MRLNLGCGYRKSTEPDVINVDNDPNCNPDRVVDLEKFPWPWDDNSIDAILIAHTLEHLGRKPKTFCKIMKEMYRVLKPNGTVQIQVPHPRSDAFWDSPTHVRPITEETLKLFCQAINTIVIKKGYANEALGIQLGIDFDIDFIGCQLMEPWKSRFESGKLSEYRLKRAVKMYNNVVDESQFVIRKVWPPGSNLEDRIKYGMAKDWTEQ